MPIPEVARRAGEALISLFFPPHCAGCGADTAPGEHVCEACAGKVRPIEPPFCQRCSEPFDGAIDGEFQCANCGDRELHFDCAVAPYLSRGVVREFIHRFKYDHEQFLRRPLANWLADALIDPRLQNPPINAIVPVPLHSTRFRERGFNQAVLLAELLCERAAHKPMVVQNRCYAALGWDQDVRDICRTQGIIYQGFSLLTANRDIFADPELRAMAAKYGMGLAQLVFRFAMQVGMLPLTGTTNQQHMTEDLRSDQFTISTEDLQRLETIGM